MTCEKFFLYMSLLMSSQLGIEFKAFVTNCTHKRAVGSVNLNMCVEMLFCLKAFLAYFALVRFDVGVALDVRFQTRFCCEAFSTDTTREQVCYAVQSFVFL